MNSVLILEMPDWVENLFLIAVKTLDAWRPSIEDY
jgi:hypothetical protein